MATPLSQAEITAALARLPGWTYQDDQLARTFRFNGFKEALSFIVRVGMHAEEAQHHPQIVNVYNTVTLSLNTHDAGGKVTGKDVDLAEAISRFDWTS